MIIVLQVNNRKNILICENQNKVERRKWELLLTRMALISGHTLVNSLFKSIYFANILTLRKAIIWLDYWYIWEGNIRYVGVKHEIYRYFFCSKIFICSIFSRFLIQIHIAVNEVQMKLIKGEVLKIFSFT